MELVDQETDIEEEFKMLVYEKLGSVKEREQFLKENFTDLLPLTTVQMMIHKGFCSAPASTKYHGSYEGGLFDHSLAVACCLQKYTDKLGLKWCREVSPLRVGILHDLCKVDLYKKVIDKPLVLDFNTEEEIPEEFHYEHDNSPIVKGHGEKSVIYALRYGCGLTEEEIACIIYHMGAYDKNRWDAYDKAIRKFPNVLFTHMADMEASKIMGV